MSNAMTKKNVYLDLSIDDNGFGFATSIDDALAQAEAELLVLNETIDSLKDRFGYDIVTRAGKLSINEVVKDKKEPKIIKKTA